MTILVFLTVLLLLAVILILVMSNIIRGRKERTVFFDGLKELREFLKEAEIGFREVLGENETVPMREMKDIKWTIASCKKKSELQDMIKELEEKIFKKAAVKNMFYYILEASTSTKRMPSYRISLDECLELPGMFVRYFNKIPGGKWELSYMTTDRVRKTLFKTIDYLRMHPTSRHGYVPIWDSEDNSVLTDKVPSLLGFYMQKGIYRDIWSFSILIRSCDIEFILYDAWFFLNIAKFCMDQLNSFPTEGVSVTFMLLNLHEYM